MNHKTMTLAILAPAAAIALGFLLPPAHARPWQEQQTSVWDGVYTAEQAKRGEAFYLEDCSNCHGRELEGADMTPPLAGLSFSSNWDGLTLGDLFERIRITMPADRPGSLARQRIADIMSHLLVVNKFPAGNAELPRELQALKQILYQATKPSQKQ